MSLNTESSTPNYLSLVIRRWYVVAVGVVVCAGLAAGVTLTGPKTYESSVTVLVYPPIFKEIAQPNPRPSETMIDLAELMPRTLPVETYRILAETEWMFAQVKVELENMGFNVRDMKSEDLKRNCRIDLIKLGGKTAGGGVLYSRAMVFHAKANQPELAKAIAQQWARLFKDKVDGLTKTGRDDTTRLIEQMWKKSRKDLQDAEKKVELFDVKWNLPLMQQRLDQKQLDLTTFESELNMVEIDIAALAASLKGIQEELKEEKKIETLFKAPPEEVYFTQKLAATTGQGETLGPENGLRTEELNPNYMTFREEEVFALSDIEGLRAEKTIIVGKIEKLAAEVEQLRKDLTEQTVVRTQLVRDQENRSERYTLVARKLEATKIAKMNEQSDIEIAADAVLAGEPAGVKGSAKVAAAGMVGALLSIGYIVASASLAGSLPGQSGPKAAQPEVVGRMQ